MNKLFASSPCKSILAWRGPSPARPDEILAARHAATMQHAMMKHASLVNGNGEQAAHLGASDLGEKLEQAVHMALNEVVAILGFSLNLGGLQDKRVKPFRGERIWPKRR